MSSIDLSVKRIRKGGLWAIAGKAFSVALGFAVSALLARILSVDELGMYFLAFSIVTAGAVLGQLGIDRTVIREVSAAMGLDDAGKCKAIILCALKWSVFSSVSIALMCYLFFGEWLVAVVLKSEALLDSLLWLAVWIIFLVLETLIANIFRGFHDIRLAVSFSGIIRSGFLAAALFLFWEYSIEPIGLDDVIMLSVFGVGVSILIGLFILRKRLINYPAYDEDLSKILIVSSLPMMAYAVTLYIVNQANIWILGGLASKDEVALYGVAMRLVLLIGVSTSIVNAVVPPLISEKHAQGDLKSIESLIRAATTICGLPAIAVLICYIFGAEWILGLVFGDFYKEASLILVVLSFGELVKVLTGPCSVALNMAGYQVQLMMISAVRMIVSLVLSLYVAGTHGALGVAVVYMICLIVNDIASMLLAKKYLGIWTLAGVRGLDRMLAIKFDK